MDDRNFDSIAKNLASARSRRDTIKGIGKAMALALGFAGPVGTIAWTRTGDARTCSEGGAICREDANCCSETCLPPDTNRRRRCSCEIGQTTCGAVCCDAGADCVNGRCRSNTATSTTTPTQTATATDTATATPITPSATATDTATATSSV
jgi:hypothetical protein